MSVWEVLSWIEFKEIRSRSDLDDRDFVLRWGHSNAGPALEALEARAAPSPFCIVHPLVLEDERWAGESYSHRACSSEGPRMLRWIRAQARKREGRLVTYAELAAQLRGELEKATNDAAQIEQARHELLEALRASKLTAWGKRNTRPGQPSPTAPYEAIAAAVFADELVSITEWGTVGADPEHPTANHKYHGASFSEVRFYSDEVISLWPVHPSEAPADVKVEGIAEPLRFRGGRPVRHDWDEFWIEVVSYAAEKGLFPEDRLQLQQHMQEWTAQRWEEPPDPATIRARLRRLFDTIATARK
jgi:hypothetical protein